MKETEQFHDFPLLILVCDFYCWCCSFYFFILTSLLSLLKVYFNNNLYQYTYMKRKKVTKLFLLFIICLRIVVSMFSFHADKELHVHFSTRLCLFVFFLSFLFCYFISFLLFFSQLINKTKDIRSRKNTAA